MQLCFLRHGHGDFEGAVRVACNWAEVDLGLWRNRDRGIAGVDRLEFRAYHWNLTYPAATLQDPILQTDLGIAVGSIVKGSQASPTEQPLHA